MSEWLYAVVSADMNLVFGCEDAIVDFDVMLTENGGGLSAWQNLLGYVPGVVKQRVQYGDARPRLLATVRYNYLAIKNHTQHTIQVREMVQEHLHNNQPTHRVVMKGNYAETRHAMLKEVGGVSATAYAFQMHHPDELREGVVGGGSGTLAVLGHPSPADIDHLNLPTAYACVDTRGQLLIVDVNKGVSIIPLPQKLPISWILRTSPDANHFMVGGIHECVGLVFGPSMENATCVEIHLTHQPRRPHSVTNRVIVWVDEAEGHRFRAITWDPDTGVVVCSEREARLFHNADPITARLVTHGNMVKIGDDVEVNFPTKTTVVTAVSGCVLGFDCTTNEHDFCRVDVAKKHAWCVGMQTEYPIVAMAPLVRWM